MVMIEDVLFRRSLMNEKTTSGVVEWCVGGRKGGGREEAVK